MKPSYFKQPAVPKSDFPLDGGGGQANATNAPNVAKDDVKHPLKRTRKQIERHTGTIIRQKRRKYK